jgi:hypothetical protein
VCGAHILILTINKQRENIMTNKEEKNMPYANMQDWDFSNVKSKELGENAFLIFFSLHIYYS